VTNEVPLAPIAARLERVKGDLSKALVAAEALWNADPEWIFAARGNAAREIRNAIMWWLVDRGHSTTVVGGAMGRSHTTVWRMARRARHDYRLELRGAIESNDRRAATEEAL